VLVIGVGSLLRGDDAIGWHVVEEIERRALPGLQTRTVTQLVPELVEVIADASVVVFVDADVDVGRPELRPVVPAGDGPLTHHGTPESLCWLASKVGYDCPPVYVLGMPASSFEMGAEPLPECLGHIDTAIGVLGEVARFHPDFPLPGHPEPL
jgi:hydrogenase maturation protease